MCEGSCFSFHTPRILGKAESDLELVMETVNAGRPIFAARSEIRLVRRNEGATRRSTELPSLLGWYRILRAHYQWPLFQAIRYALWLAR